MKDELTRADTKALWHAVECMKEMIHQARLMPTINERYIDEEEKRLKTARRALRKVNELRKQGL